jgi:hypothetical protein
VIASLVLSLWAALTPQASAQYASSATIPVPSISLGAPIPVGNGPWVIGEVLFFSKGQLVGDYAWRDRVRARRGILYTRGDLQSDVDSLMGLARFDKVTPSLYEIANTPVPPEYTTIAASTAQVRVVFDVLEKSSGTAPVQRFVAAPAPISGLVMTPTAYRGTGKFLTPGLGLDINAMYVIGRLYGKNNFQNSTTKTNYLDRVGVWMLTGDGKMQIQSETDLRPALAVGGQGTFLFRDSGQPTITDTTGANVTVNASQKTTKLLSDGYLVASKRLGPVRTSVGLMQGTMGDAVAEFSSFLTPDALTFLANQRGQTVRSRTIPFISFFGVPKKTQQLGLEIMKFNGAALSPLMINLKVGYFLHLNFDIAYLRYQGGYDLLGLIQFRYNHFPK